MTDFTLAEQVRDSQDLIERLRAELAKTQDLLEYYRDFAPDQIDVYVAPPGFFAHQIGNQNWAAGRLVNGQLLILEQGLDDEEAAVAAAWKHHKELTE